MLTVTRFPFAPGLSALTVPFQLVVAASWYLVVLVADVPFWSTTASTPVFLAPVRVYTIVVAFALVKSAAFIATPLKLIFADVKSATV